MIKKDINLTKQAINGNYTSERTKVGKGFGSGVAAGLFGRKAVGGMNASMRDSMRQKQVKVIAPYDAVNRKIDMILVQLDQLKLQIDSWIVTAK